MTGTEDSVEAVAVQGGASPEAGASHPEAWVSAVGVVAAGAMLSACGGGGDDTPVATQNYAVGFQKVDAAVGSKVSVPAGSTACPKLLPGHMGPALGKAAPGMLVSKPPAPPPWLLLAM